MNRVLLPCMRGAIGDWVTYTCLMRLEDIGSLIKFADDIHKNKELSKMIQRELRKDRQKDIGEYLLNDTEAFFNAIVVAVYEGEPKWHPFDSIKPNDADLTHIDMPDYALESMGYLSLTRDEKIFALDGQHRLSGIKYALDKDPEIGTQQIPVIFLPHYNNNEGIKRTRRLFTTLNKKARPVNKAAIIALDEDDLSACATRYLVENTIFFNENKIKFQANNNIAYSDTLQITTIGNLYDLCKIIFKTGFGLRSKEDIENYRGKENEKIIYLHALAKIFEYMFDNIPPLKEFITDINRSEVVKKYRNKQNGGYFLFRPIGLKIYLMAMCVSVGKNKDIEDFIKQCQKFIDKTKDMDLWLEEPLLKNVVWDSINKKILTFKAEERDTIIKKIISFIVN